MSDVLIVWPGYSGTQENFALASGLLIQSAGNSMWISFDLEITGTCSEDCFEQWHTLTIPRSSLVSHKSISTVTSSTWGSYSYTLLTVLKQVDTFSCDITKTSFCWLTNPKSLVDWTNTESGTICEKWHYQTTSHSKIFEVVGF